MRLLGGLCLLLVLACQAAAFPCTPAKRSDCPKPPGGLASSQSPQFITITWDDAVTGQTYGIVQSIIAGLKQRNDCAIPSTYFVTATDTIPAAVQALYLAGNEIATHTFTHPSYPNAAEITSCRDWLVKHTGIPRAKINGFRAPFLLHNAAMRKALVADGFLYDSSLGDTTPSKVSPSVKQRAWPYKMDAGIPQDCETGSCSKSEKYSLWELPLGAVADSRQQPIAAMDPSGDAFDIYERELEWRMAGNRAPLGLFFHAGLESQPERIAQLRKFIQFAAAKKDVWFVTNQQLLAWMVKPVPASRMPTGFKCAKPTDISPSVGPACDTYVSDCVFGSWSASGCRCKCMGEGSAGGYCRDKKTGQCTKLC